MNGYHGVTDQVPQVALAEAALLIGAIEEDEGLSHHLSRVAGQILLPILHIGQNIWIWTGGMRKSFTDELRV